MKTSRFRVRPGARLRLNSVASDDDGGLSRPKAEARFARRVQRLVELQEVLYAEGKHALLVVLQAPDCGGKDSTIHSVFGPLNSQGCSVTSFKAPAGAELKHDYLWRVHANVPARGEIVVFNRSHYEEVLITRVRGLVPSPRWKRRYDHIVAFERLLHDEGTTIVKFYLHISKAYQKERLERRLERPDKHWKFDPADLSERARWDDYRRAYEDVLSRCSTEFAPWYVVPAERHWYRNLLIAEVLVDTLEALKMSYPRPKVDVSKIRIP